MIKFNSIQDLFSCIFESLLLMVGENGHTHQFSPLLRLHHNPLLRQGSTFPVSDIISPLTSWTYHFPSIDASQQYIRAAVLDPDEMDKVTHFRLMIATNCFSVPISSRTDLFLWLHQMIHNDRLWYIFSKYICLLKIIK